MAHLWIKFFWRFFGPICDFWRWLLFSAIPKNPFIVLAQVLSHLYGLLICRNRNVEAAGPAAFIKAS